MKRMVPVISGILALIAFGLSVHAEPADEKAQEFVVCKSSKSVRTLSVTPDLNPSGAQSCRVTYTKAGVPQTVGEHTTSSLCHSILDHVKEHLENSKWNCKQVSATVTTSSEVSRQ